MIIVLILTSLVVGLAFSVLNLVQKHMVAIQNNYHKTHEIGLLETTLWLDFNTYSKITYKAVEDELQFTNEMDTLVYQFRENSIIKGRDTFAIALQGKQLFFNGDIANTERIDAIKLETTKASQNQKLFIYTAPDATLYMNP